MWTVLWYSRYNGAVLLCDVRTYCGAWGATTTVRAMALRRTQFPVAHHAQLRAGSAQSWQRGAPKLQHAAPNARSAHILANCQEIHCPRAGVEEGPAHNDAVWGGIMLVFQGSAAVVTARRTVLWLLQIRRHLQQHRGLRGRAAYGNTRQKRLYTKLDVSNAETTLLFRNLDHALNSIIAW